MAYEIFCMLVQCVVSHTGNNHIKCIVLEYNKMMFWPVTTLVHVSVARLGPTQYKFQLIQENKNNTSIMFLNATLII